MVVNWSPEPSKCMDGGAFSVRDNHINIDEESEDEANSPYFGYELLPHQNLAEDINSDGDSDPAEAAIMSIEQPITVINNMDKYESEETRPDIEVNPEEVRSIMTNITLPPSSFPSWAADIPESQWNSFLLSRITNMQNDKP